MLKSLKIGPVDSQQSYICAHWKTFPPSGAGKDPDVLRATKVIDEAQYSQLRLWIRVCGLYTMEEKCLTCPHRRRIEWKTRGPYLVDPSGVETPVVDAATGESAPANRHMANIFCRPGTPGSTEQAAWVKGGKNEEKK